MHKFLVDMGNNTILQKDMEDLAAVSPILRELSSAAETKPTSMPMTRAL